MDYSATRIEIIRIRRSWLLWSIPISFGLGFVYGFFAEGARSNPFGFVIGLIGLFAFVWPLNCLFKLSKAVEPKTSVAWMMVAIQLIPIIGLIAAISLVLKAGRVIKLGIANSPFAGTAETEA